MLVTRIIIRNSTMCVCEGDSARSSNFVLRIKITVTILFQKHSKNPLPPHQAFRLSQTNQTADIKKRKYSLEFSSDADTVHSYHIRENGSTLMQWPNIFRLSSLISDMKRAAIDSQVTE